MQSALVPYENWVRSEQGWYLPVFEGLKSFTMFLPGRFAENFLKSEAIYTMFNLVGMYHDSITGRPRPFEYKCGPPSANVKRAKTWLGVMELTEVLLEMIAGRKFGDTGLRSRFKWLTILGIETFKMFLKCILLANNRWRMVTQMNAEELRAHHEKQELKQIQNDLSAKLKDFPGPFPDLTAMYIENERGKLKPHGDFSGVHGVNQPLKPFSAVSAASEVLYIARPVVYCASRAAFWEEGDWRPLVLSACCDIGSRVLTWNSTFDNSELAELQSRSFRYLMYLARSPLFELAVKLPLTKLIALLSKIPLLGSIIGSLLELIIALQPIYFYTSASS